MSEMEDAIKRLDSVEWFAHAGEPIGVPTGFDVTQVTSWEEAIDLRGRDATSDAFAEASGMLTGELSDQHRAEYRNWNRIAADVREHLEARVLPRVDKTVSTVTSNDSEARLLLLSIRWDLLHFVMEHAYAHLVPPRLYEQRLRFTRAGTFRADGTNTGPRES